MTGRFPAGRCISRWECAVAPNSAYNTRHSPGDESVVTIALVTRPLQCCPWGFVRAPSTVAPHTLHHSFSATVITHMLHKHVACVHSVCHEHLPGTFHMPSRGCCLSLGRHCGARQFAQSTAKHIIDPINSCTTPQMEDGAQVNGWMRRKLQEGSLISLLWLSGFSYD